MPLITETYEGVPGGMNLALPAQELAESEARYLQDILLHRPGETIRRGPVKPITGVATTRKPATGIAQTLDPTGAHRVAVLFGDGSEGKIGLYNPAYSSLVELDWNGVLPQSPYRVFESKAALTGGTWIGTSSEYDADAPVQTLALWRGGYKANYTTGTISVSRGSVTVTGSGTSWLANVSPGMFLFANTDEPYTNTYVGVVKSVNSDTSITLGAGSPYAISGKAYTLQSLRGFCPRVVTGRITCATSATAVTGALTKFIDQAVNSGTWQLYRASDLSFIGKVASVTNNTSLTLSANAAVAMNNEAYIALRADGDWSINTMAVTQRKVGFLTAIYAERQWYANLGQEFALTSRIWFSDTSDPEAVDLSAFDGDFIDVGSSHGANTPIRQLMPAYNALMIFKDNETFGVFGNTKSTFQVKKIEDDGTLSGMSVQPYGGGVIWAGRNGIYFYDGIQAQNLTAAKLGEWYKNALRSFDPTEFRMWSMMERNHYFLHIESFQPNYAVIKGLTSVTPSRITICVNMETEAVSVHTNLGIRGSIVLPSVTGEETWYLANSSTTGYVCDASVLFDEFGLDTITCAGATAGPDLYMESKKYKVGDSLRKKLFKQLLMNYLSQGGDLRLDTVVGLNNVGKTSTTKFPATVYVWDNLSALFPTWDALGSQMPTWDQLTQSVFKPKRIKFLKRSQHLAFRIWQEDATITRVVLGPFQLGFKLQRPGRS
jgi:hypothetical protein